MRAIYFPVLMAAISIVFVFGALEIAVRTIVDDGMQFDLEMWKYARDVKTVSDDPLIGHQHGPDRSAELMGVLVETNAEGLRDRDFAFERTPGTLRIVMVGDSLTEGWGVPFEDTFSKRIERMYADKGVQAEVINTGVGNWNTVQEVQFFLSNAYRYQPDIVVLNYFVNDAELLAPSKPPSILTSHCYSCTFLMGRIDTLLRQFSERQDFQDYYLGLYGDGQAKGWMDSRAAIGRLAAYCAENDIKLLVASLPELHDVQDYQFGRITELVQEAAEENGAEFVDLLPALEDQESSTLWVTPPDPHPNALANQFLAEGLFEALQKLDDSATASAQ